MPETHIFEEIRNKVRQEKLGKITSWLFLTEDPQTHTVAVGKIIADGVLAENIRRIFLHFLEQDHVLPQEDANPLHSSLEEKLVEVPELLRLLDKSISFTFDYLIKPRKIFSEFLLEGKKDINIGAHLFSKLDSIVSYEYFPLLSGEWFTRQMKTGRTFLSQDELHSFIKNTDELIVSHATISTMIELLDPIYDFFNYRTPSPEIEIELLSSFFFEKGLDGIAQTYVESPKSTLSMREAVDILTDLLVKHKKEHSAEETIAADTNSDFHSISIPEYNTFLEDLKTVGVRLPEAPLGTDDHYLLPFEFFIGKKLRAKTIKKIFYDDEEAYNSFISRVNSIHDKEQAALTLETMIELQRIDLSSKTAMRFREALSNRFTSKEENK
jgi:hypothetical protein